jgi:serine/threonine protein kinase
MGAFIKCGPYVITDVVATMPYGSFYRAVETEGFEFIRHLLVLVPNERIVEAGFNGSAEALHGWFASFGGIRGVLSPQLFSDFDDSRKVAFPFVSGRSLRDIMIRHAEESAIQIDHVLAIAHGLAVAITNLHRSGLAHGALTPEGVWLDNKGIVHIADAPMGHVLSDLGLTNEMIGEMADLKNHFGIDFANDQESCGIILHQLVTDALPPRGGIDESVPFGMLQWDGDVVEVPELKRFIAKCLRADYANPDEFFQDALAAFNNPDHSPSTFNCAFLLQGLFREWFQAEAEAMEAEKSFDYIKAIGPQPKTVEVEVVKEVIKEVEDKRKKRRTIILASTFAAISLAIGFFAFARAKNAAAIAARTKLELERLKNDTEVLLNQSRANDASFRKDMADIAAHMANAKTAGEREALQRQADERQKAYEAAQAKIRKDLEAVQARQKSLGSGAISIPIPIVKPVIPVPAADNQQDGQTKRPGSDAAVSAADPRLVGNRVKVLMPTDTAAIPFYESTKESLTPAPNGTAPKGTVKPVELGNAVPLSAGLNVETLHRDDPKRDGHSQGGSDHASSAANAPSVRLADPGMSSRFRRLVVPEFRNDDVKTFVGQTVRVRVLFDAFGNAKTANVVECPKSMEADFRAAAMRTQIIPPVTNGKPQQGWVEFGFRIGQ